jgi:hypothetical protein
MTKKAFDICVKELQTRRLAGDLSRIEYNAAISALHRSA